MPRIPRGTPKKLVKAFLKDPCSIAPGDGFRLDRATKQVHPHRNLRQFNQTFKVRGINTERVQRVHITDCNPRNPSNADCAITVTTDRSVHVHGWADCTLLLESASRRGLIGKEKPWRLVDRRRKS